MIKKLYSSSAKDWKKVILSVCMISLVTGSAKAQLIINEIMQSNVDCLLYNNQYPDSWVELYNAGKATEKLSEYKLGETLNANEAYKLYNNTNSWGWGWGSTEKEIKAGGRVVIYCDGEGGDQHTDFSLETGKDCRLYLFKNNQVVDSLPDGMKKQPSPNIAFGRKSDGNKEWGYQLTPTPNGSNSGGICSRDQILEDPIFSIGGRVFKSGETFSLQLSMPEDSPENVQIRYTTDGSEPTKSSTLYSKEITIAKTTVIRAKAFLTGWLSPRSITQSYICMDRDVTLPVFSLTTDSKHLYNSSTGILASSNVTDKSKEWRRPINVEFFENDDLESSVVNQLCETRVSGNWTRRFPLRTLAVYAKKRFGTKHFKYEFFPEQRPGIDDFKSLLLRNSGNDFPYIYSRDAVIQAQLGKHCDVDWQAGRPAIIFINGEYKGMVNIRERSNDDGIYSNYDKLENIDMVENWNELKAGNQSHWDSFRNFYGSTHTYAQWSKQLDVEEFMNVMIANIVHCNLDFPGNNICFWRPSAEGGRWRVQIKDIDYALGIYDRATNTNTSNIMNGDVYKIKVDYDYIKWLYTPNYDSHYNWGNGSDATKLFRNLMSNADIKKDFIDRLAVYMGDFLSFEQTWEDTWEPWSKSIESEIKYHRELYGLAPTGYQTELEKAKTWLQNRIPYVYNHVKSYYSLGAVTPLTINTDMTSEERGELNITFNKVKLSRNSFNGSFFANRAITLTGDVEGWKVTEEYASGDPVVKNISGNVLDYKIPTNCKGVSIVSQSNADMIFNINTNNDLDDESMQIYDISGRRVNGLQQGLNIIKTRNGTKKVYVK